MPGRNTKSYLGFNKNIRASKRLSANDTGPGPARASTNFLYQVSDFFNDYLLGWLLNNAKAQPRADAPDSRNSIHELKNGNGDTDPVSIALTGDWASDTRQSAHIGKLMGAKEPDYTIHLGDTYYSGTEPELKANFYAGANGEGSWPRGKAGSFALLGNHEMYAGGQPFFDMIQNQKFGMFNAVTKKFEGQHTSYFCLRSEHWCILGLDTGYDSLGYPGPTNKKLKFTNALMEWLRDDVKLADEKRGIIVLTHHQYSSGFKAEQVFINPAEQLKSFFPNQEREIIWIWGHEHRFAMYGKYKEENKTGKKYISAYGRCIGNGGMPDEHLLRKGVSKKNADKYKLVVYDGRTAEEYNKQNFEVELGYNSYAVMSIKGKQLDIRYYTAYMTDDGVDKGEKSIVHETWQTDNTTGDITCLGIKDLTVGEAKDKDKLSYYKTADPMRAGR
jgi:predicted phosphodiesterase